MSFFDARIPVSDNRAGREENTNGGAYVWREEFFSPCIGIYLNRSVCSFHGDLEEMPEWQRITLAEYLQRFRQAMRENAQLPKDLRVGEMAT